MNSKKLRDSARGQDCLIRIPQVCNFNPETTVLAHTGEGGGMGGKASDLTGAFACSACHDAIDGRLKTDWHKEELELMAKEGNQRTLEYWAKTGLLKVAA